jgi:hypothetical protein
VIGGTLNRIRSARKENKLERWYGVGWCDKGKNLFVDKTAFSEISFFSTLI